LLLKKAYSSRVVPAVRPEGLTSHVASSSSLLQPTNNIYKKKAFPYFQGMHWKAKG